MFGKRKKTEAVDARVSLGEEAAAAAKRRSASILARPGVFAAPADMAPATVQRALAKRGRRAVRAQIKPLPSSEKD
jgi:hypothetical protein